MKKLLSLILIAVMVLSLVACGGGSGEGSGETPKGEYSALKVGFHRVNITPDWPVGLGGYDSGNSRISSGLVSYLYLTCIAFTEGEETVLMFTLDNCAVSQSRQNELRKLVADATGIPENKQFYGATHTHSAPSYGSSITGGGQALTQLHEAAIEAAKKALEDQAPAKPYHTAFNAGDMAFNRNYVKDEVTGTKSYLAEADSTMVLLKFDREEKKDILMVNFGSHPDHSTKIGFNNISADFPGALRDKVIKETGMEVAYFTAASGDQTPFSEIPADNLGITMQEYGERLADHAIANLANLQPVEGSGIATKQVIYKAEVDHHLDHLLTQAREVYQLYQDTGNNLEATRPLANQYGLQSAYEARAVISRASMGPTIDMDTSAIRIGGIGFISGTYEMYAESGKYIRDNDPYAASFIIMGNNSYVASEAAFDLATYEAVTGYYAKGTAEKMAEHYVQMLKDIQ